MKIILFLLLCLSLQTGCTNKTDASNVYRSESGLSVSMKKPIADVEINKNGFMFFIAPRESRQNNYISVTISNVAPDKIDGAKTKENIDYLYLIEEFEGGSGGKETIIKIWKPCIKSDYILIERYVQSDKKQSDGLAWEVAENSKCDPK